MNSLELKGIYFIYDPARLPERADFDPENFLKTLLPHLAFMQLRSSTLTDRQLLAEAEKLKDLSLKYSVKFIINNRLDIALLSGADGVHLGSEDIPLASARKIFKGIIGASRHSVEGARRARDAGADYIGAGPVFTTGTKDTGRNPIGIDKLRKIKERVDIPVVPVGGINRENIVKLKGLTNCAALSAGLMYDADPEGACKKLEDVLLGGSPQKGE